VHHCSYFCVILQKVIFILKQDLRKLSLPQLEELMLTLGEPKFRAKQIHGWLWNKAIQDIGEMSNLPKSLREKLEESYEIFPAREKIVQKSKDGTIKIGYELNDNRLIEGVLIPTDDRMTACVSSQVGCTLNCSFCATGMLKRERNLEPGEIYDQIVSLNNQAIENFGKPLSNIVYMGMGEPLLNYDNVLTSIEKVTSTEGLGMSPRRITLSTVGVARNIIRLADEGKRFNLALSLHAPTNEKRAQIMDINKSNPIEKVMEALQYFYSKTKNKITFEYILFDGFNDSIEDAKELVKLCRKVPAFVNIIEYNKVDGVTLNKAQIEKRDAFVAYLEANGVTAKVRISRGEDIDAACGQLANKN
jgi:23S rRNA (adenine2503-C2)-methyltransferase